MTINYQFPYYPYTQFPGQPGYNQLGGTPYSNQYQSSFRPFENSYIENILRLNLGKTATIYMNFENSQAKYIYRLYSSCKCNRCCLSG